MSYIDRILQPGEEVIAIGRMHWIVYARAGLLALVGIAMLLWPMESADVWRALLRVGGGLVTVYGLFAFLRSWIEVVTTEVAVTNLRVIQKRGLISRRTGEMNMEKVESVTVDQSLTGRILNYGSVVIRGTGAGIEGLHHIADPLGLRNAIVVR